MFDTELGAFSFTALHIHLSGLVEMHYSDDAWLIDCKPAGHP